MTTYYVPDEHDAAFKRWLPSDTIEKPVLTPARTIDEACHDVVRSIPDYVDSHASLILRAEWSPLRDMQAHHQHGVTLLKHLRMTPIVQCEQQERNLALVARHRLPVILCSFEPVEELIRRCPGSAILLSPGVTFLRLPEALPTLQAGCVTRVRVPRGDTVLRPYIAADYRPPDSAHAFSNWWGVYQVCTATGIKVPASVEGELQVLHNKEAAYLASAVHKPGKGTAHIGAEASLQAMYSTGEGPRLCLVDDEADRGWAAVLCNSVLRTVPYDRLEDVFRLRSRIPHWNDMYEREQWVRDNIISFDPDVVLLDVRLYGDEERDAEVSDTSGMRILRTIRRVDPGLPVIVLTASNKFWTYRQAVASGVDGFWMKEGIGEHRPRQLSADEHYADLLTMMLRCLNKQSRYSYLRRLSRRFRNLRDHSGLLWWMQHQWQDAGIDGDVELRHGRLGQALSRTCPARSTVIDQFGNALALYREYLQMFEAKTAHIGHRNRISLESEMLQAVTVAAFKVIEKMHELTKFRAIVGSLPDTDRARVGKSTNQLLQYRGDALARALLGMRHPAAHGIVRQPRVGVRAPTPSADAVQDYLAAVLAHLCEVPVVDTRDISLAEYVTKNQAFRQTYTSIKGSDSVDETLGGRVNLAR